jgi:hypothetical protein
MKRFVEGLDRGQSTLFPETLEGELAHRVSLRIGRTFIPHQFI